MMIRLVQAVGISAALVFVVALYMEFGLGSFVQIGGPGERLPGGFRGHVLAMEFVRNGDDVERVVGPPGHVNRETMRRKINVDFVWIGCYTLLFFLVAVLLAGRGVPSSIYMAAVAFICAASAAGFDVVENRGMLGAMELPKERATAEALQFIREAALLKWALSYVAVGVLALTFFGGDRWVSSVGYFFAAAAVSFAGLWHHPLIGLSVLPLVLGLLLLAVQALKRPEAFLR